MRVENFKKAGIFLPLTYFHVKFRKVDRYYKC